MRYRTKLYLALLSISFISILLALGVVYKETKEQFINEYSSKVLSIAATTAALLDGDAVAKIRKKEDVNLPEYAMLREQLQKARDANRRSDVYVKWLYTFWQSEKDPEQFLYGVDTEEGGKDYSYPGDVYLEAPSYNLLHHFRSYFAPKEFIRDPEGDWLMASAPILDSKGHIVGGVEADIQAHDIIVLLHKLLMFGITALCISSSVSITLGYLLARGITRPLHALYDCVKQIEGGNLGARVTLKTHDEFNELALAINDMSRGLEERERLKTGFARYVSQHALEKLLQSESYLKLQGERRKITVLFSDIRQFTTLSEQLPPEQVVGILNEYFEKMIEAVFRNNGTLDKFLGDGMMVEFGAPLEDPRQEINAVSAALEMQKEMVKLCDRWEKEGRPRIEMGIGIHTGYAVVGNIGSVIRTEYTAIGDTVNVASRLEFATKALKTSILISEETFNALPPNLFKSKRLGPIPLHGRASEIVVYAISPFDELTPPNSL